MIYITTQCEKSLKSVSNCCFNLFGRHSIIKGCNCNDRNFNGWEEIYRQAHHAHDAKNTDDEAADNDKIGIFERKSWHLLNSITLGGVRNFSELGLYLHSQSQAASAAEDNQISFFESIQYLNHIRRLYAQSYWTFLNFIV